MCNLVIVGEAQDQNPGSDFGLVGVCAILSVLVTIDPKDQNTFFLITRVFHKLITASFLLTSAAGVIFSHVFVLMFLTFFLTVFIGSIVMRNLAIAHQLSTQYIEGFYMKGTLRRRIAYIFFGPS